MEPTFAMYDAVRIVRFPDDAAEVPVRYSETGRTHLRLGDVGVVIGPWSGNEFRIEAVDRSGAIDWQAHLASDQLEPIPTTEAPYCRRRVNESWARSLMLNGTEMDPDERGESLDFARKVMAFARTNVEVLVDRLTATGYRFAADHPYAAPGDDVASALDALAAAGVSLPIALQAWLLEVGSVDLRGSHPDWPRSAYVGYFDDDPEENDYWYTDPLVVQLDLPTLVQRAADDAAGIHAIDIAPDALTKANFNGGSPIRIDCRHPAFDSVLIGQHGSVTLFSYLARAFDWAGFPGFDFTPAPPHAMLASLKRELVRL